MSPVVDVSEDRISPGEWDDFAMACGASFRCAWHALWAWQLDHHRLFRLRRLEILLVEDGRRTKIAQCAVGIGRRRRVFADSLQLLPGHAHRWSEVMQAVLRHLGPGAYHYGSQWNLEAPREPLLQALPGVVITQVEPITLDVVDFRQWPHWDGYLREVSSNAKRNAKRARETHPDLAVSLRHGLASLADWGALNGLRAQLSSRKALGLTLRRTLPRFLLRLAALGPRNFIAIARAGENGLAGFSGIDFGANTYFLEAGSGAVNQGASWYLMLGMLERAWRRAPQGAFIMGAQYERQVRDEGLAFSRRQCRVQRLPTSEILFEYDGSTRLLAPVPARPAESLREVVEELALAARIGLEGSNNLPV